VGVSPGVCQALDRFGVTFTRIAEFADIDRFRVLIIGNSSVNKHVLAASRSIRRWIAAGGRLLVLEQQNPIPVPAMPGMSVVKKYGGVIADLWVPEHPIFRDINRVQNWDRWSDRLPDAQSYGREGGMYCALLAPLNKTVLATGLISIPRASNTAVRMLVSEVRHGDGIALFSQAEAVRRLDRDSVATKYLRNLFEYMLSDAVQYATPLSDFTVGELEVFHFGYLDLERFALAPYEMAPDWRGGIQEGLRDLGDLRFLPVKEKVVKLDAEQPELKIDYAVDMKLMFPEREREKRRKDVDQLGLRKDWALELFFLLSCSPGEDGRKVGKCTISYQDGSAGEFELIRGENIGPRDAADDIENGAYIGNGLYVCRWINPRQNASIARLGITLLDEKADLYVAGITGVLIRQKKHD